MKKELINQKKILVEEIKEKEKELEKLNKELAKLPKRNVGDKVVLLYDDFQLKGNARWKKMNIITITGLNRILDDYGDKHKVDKGVNEKGTKFFETAAPLLGWFWYSNRGKGTWKNITNFGYGLLGSNAELLIDNWTKFASKDVRKIIGKCRKHKSLYYKSEGCFSCICNLKAEK